MFLHTSHIEHVITRKQRPLSHIFQTNQDKMTAKTPSNRQRRLYRKQTKVTGLDGPYQRSRHEILRDPSHDNAVPAGPDRFSTGHDSAKTNIWKQKSIRFALYWSKCSMFKKRN